MKQLVKVFVLLLTLCFAVVFNSCKEDSNTTEVQSKIDPFNDGSNERSMVVVISDMHLGADTTYAECSNNLKALEKFLTNLKASQNVKELVIAGDLFDEWFVPADLDTYQGKGQLDFVKRIEKANQTVFDVLNSIILEGKIEVTYVPGNHDLTISSDCVNAALPDIKQARDTGKLGLGKYVVDTLPIVIEHGHRYNFFCAPDPYSNPNKVIGSILPPGYFFTRIAALHDVQKNIKGADTINVVTPSLLESVSQQNLFHYYDLWKWALNLLTIDNKFDQKLIVTNINNWKDTCTVNSLVPTQKGAGGFIELDLFNDIQDSWHERLKYNNVEVDIPTAQAITNSNVAKETDDQASSQYFDNPNSNKRIVVFGHTHVAKIIPYTNKNGEKCVYANSGTWIDHNNLGSTMNFVVITPQKSEANSQTTVKLYNYQNEVVTQMAVDSLRY